jgi:hypothetical protein
MISTLTMSLSKLPADNFFSNLRANHFADYHKRCRHQESPTLRDHTTDVARRLCDRGERAGRYRKKIFAQFAPQIAWWRTGSSLYQVLRVLQVRATWSTLCAAPLIPALDAIRSDVR